MDELNPYAPPEAEVGGAAKKPKKTKKSKRATGEIADAIERLNEHLANPGNVELDRKEAGGKIRTITYVFVVIATVFTIGMAILATNARASKQEAILISAVLVGLVFGGLAVALLVIDLKMTPRDQPVPPVKTLQHFFKAIALGRLGYAWSALCPTARDQSVEPPVLGEIPIGPGSFTLRSTHDFKEYLATFARPGAGQMRTMQIKRVNLLTEDGDVAIVEVETMFQAWPQWAQIVSVVGFVLVRLLGIILFLVLYLSLRKTQTVTFRKTLIRGSNGVWYVYSADLLEGAGRAS
jgi:hypothetical protein